MKYEIVRSENEEKLLKDIEERLDETLWCMDGCRQIMLVPVGLITKDGKIELILHTDMDLLMKKIN